MLKVKEKILKKNPWYVDNQFKIQFENPVYRVTILRRWNVWKEFIAEWLKNNRSRKSSIKILDAGCGDGINLIGLKKIFRDLGHTSYLIYGVDYNFLQIKRARQLEVTALIVGDLCSVPFKLKSFDIILCNHVLEHIPDDFSALSQLWDILACGGMMIIDVPNEGCFLARLRNYYLQPSILTTTDHVNFYTVEKIKYLLKKLNVYNYEIKKAGFFYPHLKLLYLRKLSVGRKLEDILTKLIPSQSAELIIKCIK